MLRNTYTKCLNLHHLSCQKGFKKKYRFSITRKTISHQQVPEKLGLQCPSTLWREEDQCSLLALPYPNIRQKQRSDVDSSVFYFVHTAGVQGKKQSRWETTGRRVRVRHFLGESSVRRRGEETRGARARGSGGDRGLQEAPPKTAGEDTGGKTWRQNSTQKWSLGQPHG